MNQTDLGSFIRMRITRKERSLKFRRINRVSHELLVQNTWAVFNDSFKSQSINLSKCVNFYYRKMRVTCCVSGHHEKIKEFPDHTFHIYQRNSSGQISKKPVDFTYPINGRIFSKNECDFSPSRDL